MRQGLVLFVLAVAVFLKATGGCEPMSVCERPNHLQACGQRPLATTSTTVHRGGAGANRPAPVPSNPSMGGT